MLKGTGGGSQLPIFVAAGEVHLYAGHQTGKRHEKELVPKNCRIASVSDSSISVAGVDCDHSSVWIYITLL